MPGRGWRAELVRDGGRRDMCGGAAELGKVV